VNIKADYHYPLSIEEKDGELSDSREFALKEAAVDIMNSLVLFSPEEVGFMLFVKNNRDLSTAFQIYD
jgi:hypothetical protein